MKVRINLVVSPDLDIDISKITQNKRTIVDINELSKIDFESLTQKMVFYFIDLSKTQTEKGRQEILEAARSYMKNGVNIEPAVTVIVPDKEVKNEQFEFPDKSSGYASLNIIAENMDLIPDIETVPIYQQIISDILSSKDVTDTIRKLQAEGILKDVMPSLSNAFDVQQNSYYHKKDSVADHILRSVDAVLTITDDKLTILATAYHDVGKVQTISVDKNGENHFFGHFNVSSRAIGKELKVAGYTDEELRKMKKIIELHEFRVKPDKKFLENYIDKNNLSKEDIIRLIHLQMSDSMGQQGQKYVDEPELLETIIKDYQEAFDLAIEIFKEREGLDEKIEGLKNTDSKKPIKNNNPQEIIK